MKLDWIDAVGSMTIAISASGKIASANNLACNVLKYTGPEISGLDFGSILEDPDKVVQNFIDGLANEGCLISFNKTRLIGRTGEKHPVHGTAIRINETDTNFFLLFCYLTKSEGNRHCRENELLIRDFQIKTLGRMTEGLVNDFRNIFGIVVGYTEMARESLPEDNEIQNDLSEVLAACDRGKKLLNNINALCKNNQVGNINLDAERCIGATVNTIKTVLPQNVTLQYSSIIDKSSIAVDPMKLEQLLLGISLALGDLSRISKSKDTITIILGNKKIKGGFTRKAPEEGLYVQILIESDGIDLDNGFIEEFNNYSDELLLSSHDEPAATLFAARRILLDLNGHILLDPGGFNRTAISILFPVVDKNAMVKPTYLGPPCGHGQCVLVVDDEIQVADLTEKRLNKLGYRVITKTNSRDALEYFANNYEKFSLLITDQIMPDLLGLDLAKEVLKIKPDIPIIMMAGYSSGITDKKCRESGIKHLAMKPIDEKELATIVANALR